MRELYEYIWWVFLFVFVPQSYSISDFIIDQIIDQH